MNMNDSFENCPEIAKIFLDKSKNVQVQETPAITNIIFNVLLMITATLGNGMIIVAISRSQNLRTPSYLLITSLAFGDLLVGLIFHPLQIVVGTYHLQRNFKGMCTIAKIYIFFIFYLNYVSQLMVTCISIDRYLALTLGHRYTIIVTKKRVRLLIVLLWSMAILLALLTIIEQLFAALLIINYSLSLVLLSITCGFYIKSFRALHVYTVQVHAQQPNPLAGNFDVVRYKKTLKTMLVVLACLLLCYMPSVCVLVFKNIIHDQKETIFLYILSVSLMGLNSSINPVIYLIRFSDIRNACKEMFRSVIQ